MASARCRASSQSRGSLGLILHTSLQRAALVWVEKGWRACELQPTQAATAAKNDKATKLTCIWTARPSWRTLQPHGCPLDRLARRPRTIFRSCGQVSVKMCFKRWCEAMCSLSVKDLWCRPTRHVLNVRECRYSFITRCIGHKIEH